MKNKAIMACGQCGEEFTKTDGGYECLNPECLKPGGIKMSGSASIKVDDDD